MKYWGTYGTEMCVFFQKENCNNLARISHTYTGSSLLWCGNSAACLAHHWPQPVTCLGLASPGTQEGQDPCNTSLGGACIIRSASVVSKVVCAMIFFALVCSEVHLFCSSVLLCRDLQRSIQRTIVSDASVQQTRRNHMHATCVGRVGLGFSLLRTKRKETTK